MGPNRPQGDQQRVCCPNCHTNNFVGQAQCWQCRAPLLSSGAGRSQSAPGFASSTVQLTPSVHHAQYAPPVAPGRGSSARPNILLLVGIGMMTFVVVLRLYMRSQSNTASIERSASAVIGANRTAPDPVAGIPSGQENSISPDVSAPTAAPNAGAAPGATGAGGDPLEDAAKRVIIREAPDVGLPPPAAASADGQVHLRTGGTISTEEWNAARRKLQDNPLLKQPPPPPPF